MVITSSGQPSFPSPNFCGQDEVLLDNRDKLQYVAKPSALQKLHLPRNAIAHYWHSDLVLDHAVPPSSLRDRDIQALSDLFQRDDIHELEADMARYLLLLFPVPYWEDDPFDFLREFL